MMHLCGGFQTKNKIFIHALLAKDNLMIKYQTPLAWRGDNNYKYV
jgi:hypothetical protein